MISMRRRGHNHYRAVITAAVMVTAAFAIAIGADIREVVRFSESNNGAGLREMVNVWWIWAWGRDYLLVLGVALALAQRKG